MSFNYIQIYGYIVQCNTYSVIFLIDNFFYRLIVSDGISLFKTLRSTFGWVNKKMGG